MLAPGQEPQHPRRVGGVGGLAENLLVDADDGVGGEHGEPAQPALHDAVPAHFRLGAADPADVIVGQLGRELRLVDVGAAARRVLAQHQHLERHADLLQQLAPSRAARGEIDQGPRGVLDHSRWYG